MSRWPNLFLIGAPKCGTTAICDQLGQHPEIFIPERKELDFFNTDMVCGPDEIRITEETDYLSYFAKRTEKYCGDGSITYLFSRAAPDNIIARKPDAKILAVLRNPFALVSSLYHFRRFNDRLIASDIEACLDEEERYFTANHPADGPMDTLYKLSGFAQYADGVERYQTLFGRENFHIIIYEDLIADRGRIFRDIFRFLDVDADFTPVNTVINKTRIKRSQFIHILMSRAFQLPPVRYSAQKLPKRVRHRIYSRIVSLNTVKAERPPLEVHLRDRLMPKFRRDVEKLSTLIDRDLSFWLADPADTRPADATLPA